MGEKIIIDSEYQGYVFLGWAAGRFESAKGEMMPYFNMYVLSPVSTFESEDYKAFGFKAEKKKCISANVWDNLEIGEKVRLFFDDKGRVVMAASDA